MLIRRHTIVNDTTIFQSTSKLPRKVLLLQVCWSRCAAGTFQMRVNCSVMCEEGSKLNIRRLGLDA